MNLRLNVTRCSTIACLSLMLPYATAAPKPFQMIPPKAVAQVPDDRVTRDLVDLYAKVVLEIEPYRVETVEASNNANGEADKSEIRRQFIQKATEILEAYGMAVADYNRITIQLRQDEDLKERIETAIRSLQKNDSRFR